MTSRLRSLAAVACAVVLLAAGCASGDDNAAARTADLEARIADLESDLEAALATAAPTTTTTTTTTTTEPVEDYGVLTQREAACHAASAAKEVLVDAYNETADAINEADAAGLTAIGDFEADPASDDWDRVVAALDAYTMALAANVAPAVELRASNLDFIAACDGTELLGPAQILNAKAAVLAIDEDLAWFADEWCADLAADRDLEHFASCPPEALHLAEADYPPIPG